MLEHAPWLEVFKVQSRHFSPSLLCSVFFSISPLGGRGHLVPELLRQDALVQTVAGVEHQEQVDIRCLHDVDARHRARFVVVGDGIHRPLVGLQHLEGDARLVRQQRPAPAPRPERADRRQRQKLRIDRQDRPEHGEIVGRRAGGRGDQAAVAAQFFQAHLAINGDPELGRLVRLPEERHFVDGEAMMHPAVPIDGAHRQGVDDGDLRRREALAQVLGRILVREKADRSPVHAIDRDLVVEVAMQRREHEAVAAERHDGVRLLGLGIPVERRKLVQRLQRVRRLARDERDLGKLSR